MCLCTKYPRGKHIGIPGLLPTSGFQNKSVMTACINVLFTTLAVRAGIHLPKYKGKYNAWVVATSRSEPEAEPDGKLQKPTLIITGVV